MQRALASELFRGPMGNEEEGIGTGLPENGRLPEVLQNLLERERIGDGRQPREDIIAMPAALAAARQANRNATPK